tara:strand:+ start:2614 stop:2955 length:342 start_codon:yes stop_codon:yes gene_type:complete
MKLPATARAGVDLYQQSTTEAAAKLAHNVMRRTGAVHDATRAAKKRLAAVAAVATLRRPFVAVWRSTGGRPHGASYPKEPVRSADCVMSRQRDRVVNGVGPGQVIENAAHFPR